MKVRFLSVAEAELDEAIAYYEEKELGLGLRFFSEVKNSVDRIVAYPHAWPTPYVRKLPALQNESLPLRSHFPEEK